MNVPPRFSMLPACCLFFGLTGISAAWTPGTYPPSPLRMHTRGFTVDTQNRNDVISFWHAVYQASEGFETRIRWTGNYTGNPGTISPAFVGDVERRLNYFRAMCGAPANARVNSGSTVSVSSSDQYIAPANALKSAAAQAGAVMLVRNYNAITGANLALTHNPPNTLIGWSPSAWNGIAKGNFSFGFYGPHAITEYMLEQYASDSTLTNFNNLVGHRRWSLLPSATDFATGDQPGASFQQPPSNVFYVINKPSELVAVEPKFIAYPPAGFSPAALNSPFWSLSRAGADFSSAQVTMTDANGMNIPIKSVERNNSFGDPAIIWGVDDSVFVSSVYQDKPFNVSITGINGPGVPSSYDYTVTLINPDYLTSDQSVTGASQAWLTPPQTYSFTPPQGSEALQMVVSMETPTQIRENAERGRPIKVIDGTSPTYPLICRTSTFRGFGGVSGANAYRLTFASVYDLTIQGIRDQKFELDYEIVPSSTGKLSFKFRRGYMTPTTKLAVEISDNHGVTWAALGEPISGLSDRFDATSTNVTLALPESDRPIRIRFRYYSTGGSVYTHEAAKTFPTGIFVDDITTTGCSLWSMTRTVPMLKNATQFTLTPVTAGSPFVAGRKFQLRLQTKLGGKWMPPGTAKRVTTTL